VEEIEYTTDMIEIGLYEALFIYSDGVEDTVNGAGEFYGRERLLELLAVPANSASVRVEQLSTSLAKFMGEAKPFDDVTVLVIMRQLE
jgi:sigma-B regulation protein RsbU (phosphoserine phosphatase)